jgi:hypothetical protein
MSSLFWAQRRCDWGRQQAIKQPAGHGHKHHAAHVPRGLCNTKHEVKCPMHMHARCECEWCWGSGGAGAEGVGAMFTFFNARVVPTGLVVGSWFYLFICYLLFASYLGIGNPESAIRNAQHDLARGVL